MPIALRSILAALLAAGLAGGAAAEDCGLKLATTVEIQLGEDGSVLVPATLGGQQTLLILDTGAFWSVARQGLIGGLPVKRSAVEAVGIAGGRHSDYVTVPSLRLGTLAFSNVDFMVMPDALAADDSRIGGNIAANLLRAFDLEIDPAGRRISLFSQDHCKGKVFHWPHKEEIAVPLDIDRLGDLTIPVGIDGKGVWAAIDTGSAASLLGLDAAKRLFGLTPASPGVEPIGSAVAIDGKELPSYRYRFKTLAIEGVTFQNPWLTLADNQAEAGAGQRRFMQETGAKPHDLLLGMHQLRDLHLYFAYGEHMLYASTVAGDRAAAASAATAPARTADALDLAEADKLSQSAGAHLAAREFAQARQEVDEAIRVAPSVAALYLQRGIIDQSDGSPQAALGDYSKAIELDGALVEAYLDRGMAYLRAGDLPRAQADLDRAVALAPQRPEVFFARGELHLRRLENDAAIRDFGDALRLDAKFAEALVGRCQARTAAGQVQAALADCDQAIALKPGDAAPLDARGLAHGRAGQLDLAIADFTAALQIDPHDAMAQQDLAVARQLKGGRAGGAAAPAK